MLLAMYSIFVFIFIGYAAKILRLVGNKQSGILLGFLLNFALPAQVFNGTYHAEINLAFLFMCLIALLCNICGTLILLLIGKLFRIDRESTIVLCLMGMLGNTLYLGLPIIKGALGEDYANQVVIYDQFVTGIPFAFLAPIMLSLGGKGVFSVSAVLVRLFKSPLFLSLLCGFAFRLIPFEIPKDLFVPLQSLAQTATPVALFAIGVQLELKGILDWKLTTLLLSVKMILAPLILFCFVHFVMGGFTNPWRMVLLEVAMPPLVSGVALALKAKLNGRLALNSVAFGLLASFMTIPLWLYVIAE
ncbi:AEC family transporter [Helicobacter sp. MIT 14-3879]|uniref:AEC family transporter n=1 Tax=Helicobacter sp. MIT 14-3879 TaxID=2040649 RepID=UPI000E1F025E|nr:AEC family transporter [Helicobacter sp. MIT 14-3879]RDU60913.1 AEC family transporter [Helicobacter sp. MIT 14-3879]